MPTGKFVLLLVAAEFYCVTRSLKECTQICATDRPSSVRAPFAKSNCHSGCFFAVAYFFVALIFTHMPGGILFPRLGFGVNVAISNYVDK